MISIETNSVADLFFQLRWSSGEIVHADAYAGRQVNFWRDLLPPRLTEQLWGKKPGDRVTIEFTPGELFNGSQGKDVRRLSRDQFDPQRIGAPDLPPRMGRFYPKGLLKDVAGIFRENIVPFRCVGIDNRRLVVDLGHPLAENPLSLSVTVGTLSSKPDERGGGMQDWTEIMTQGTGMQARWRGQATDFFRPSAFDREDETSDTTFYEKPRMVQHMDETALDLVRDLYGRFIHSDMKVLDLMASWDSHLPACRSLARVTGIGLNAFELEQNTVLTDYRVHDLNADPMLPLPQNAYDVVVCTGSVEYLTSPQAVFDQVARVLRPDGHFIVTFSNRWFPPKVVAIWSQLHEFERMGLVLEYFQATKAFTDLKTYSVRGLDRPLQDKYFGQLRFGDPVYAVWGRKV
jgi:SAM-dependent methyltransferase/FKBP-type peptidyl-prolyl cis-trans isomerase 2